MNWQDARNEALDKWFAIRDLVGVCEPEAFIALVRDTTGMCHKSMEEADLRNDHANYCLYCISFEQYGGCKQLIDAMCESANKHDWGSVYGLTTNMIGMLDNLNLESEEEQLCAPIMN